MARLLGRGVVVSEPVSQSVARLSLAFGLSDRRAAAYVSELEAARVNPDRLETAIRDAVQNLDRCPSISELLRRCAGARSGDERRLSDEETRALIIRRLLSLDMDPTPERIRAHWHQFRNEFSTWWPACPCCRKAPVSRSRVLEDGDGDEAA